MRDIKKDESYVASLFDLIRVFAPSWLLSFDAQNCSLQRNFNASNNQGWPISAGTSNYSSMTINERPATIIIGDAEMIPKTIHYCWFGKAPMSDLNKRCIDSWRRVMPDYQIKEWNETNSPLDNAYSQRAYAKELWSRLSNHVRLHALYTEGGIYLDTDVEVIKSFAPLLHHKCFVGFQVEEEQVDWVNTAVLGAQPEHQFLKRGMELTRELFAETGEFYRSPTVTTTILKEMGLKEYGLQEIKEVTVYPVEYFYPYPWFGKFARDCIKENTYCVHYWEGTWRKKEHSKVLHPLRIIKRIVRTLISKCQ